MEKFQTFRRGKLILFSAFFLFSMICVFIACRNDLNLEQPYSETSPKPLSTEVIEFKQAFETNYHFDASKITDASRFGKIEPIWSQAIAENGVLEVPIMMNGKLTLPSLYNGLLYKGKQRLVMYGKSPKSAMFIMNLMPSEGFQMKDVNTLNYRKKSFDGLISIFTENGKSIGAYLFSKGALTEKFKRITSNSLTGSCTCVLSTYECYCGSVNGGCLQCSICYSYDCYGNCGDDGVDDEDPCNGPSPPSYCGDEDPCNGPNAPPYCSNEGVDNNEEGPQNPALLAAIQARTKNVQGNRQCVEFQATLKLFLGLNAHLYGVNSIEYCSMRLNAGSYIYYEGIGNISDNGVHKYTVIDFYVFDNNHPKGVRIDEFNRKIDWPFRNSVNVSTSILNCER